MRADDLIKRFAMEPHPENGTFIERHYSHEGEGRAASGSIFYYVAPGEHTEFHRIDCDEYWVYNAGESAELWVIDLQGRLQTRRCGPAEGADPCVRFAAGEIFAARLPKDARDGCFVTCITVPRFQYEGFALISREVMTEQYPETKPFWD